MGERSGKFHRLNIANNKAVTVLNSRSNFDQEDIYPVAQYEKLWGDMTAVEGMDCSYFIVSRQRGQQLKDPAQLDGWSRDGGAAYLDSICMW